MTAPTSTAKPTQPISIPTAAQIIGWTALAWAASVVLQILVNG